MDSLYVVAFLVDFVLFMYLMSEILNALVDIAAELKKLRMRK